MVSDGYGGTDSETITITVDNVNLPPHLGYIGNRIVMENTLISFTVVGFDEGSGALTFSASPLPAGAAFDSSSRTFSWIPTTLQGGTHEITFTVADSFGASYSEIVSIQVNRAPALAIGNKTVDEGSLLAFDLPATDADGDILTYSVSPSSLPSGAAFNPSTRTFSWMPYFHQAGTYQICFNANDGLGGTGSETITITVNNVNHAPLLHAIDEKIVIENSLLSFTVFAADPDSESLSYRAVNLPAGAAFDQNTRTFSWVPTALQAGTYQVSFSVTDPFGLTDSKTVAIKCVGGDIAYNGRETPASISAENATRFFRFIFGGTLREPALLMPSSPSPQTLAKHSAAAVSEKITSLSGDSEPVQGSLHGIVGGSADYEGYLVEDGTGFLTFTFHAFDDGRGFIYDGTMNVTIDTYGTGTAVVGAGMKDLYLVKLDPDLSSCFILSGLHRQQR